MANFRKATGEMSIGKPDEYQIAGPHFVDIRD
jgi:hypothetical protein